MNSFAHLELEIEAAKLVREKREAKEKATADQIVAVAALQRDVARLSALEARHREKIATLEHQVAVLIAHARGKPFERSA